MPNVISSEVAARIREAFQRALETSVPAYELGQLRLFQEDEEEYINKEVARRLYEPLLPNAGARERKWVERLKKLARDTDWADAMKASFAARTWESLLPENPRHPGRYYMRHSIKPNNKAEFGYYTELKEVAHRNRQWDRKWFAQMMLDGLPEGVSNFQIECLYLLKKCDGNMDRLVRLVNDIGERTGVEVLDAEGLHAPQKFRKWCLAKGNFTWGAGEKELQKLHEDIAHQVAWRTVEDVVQVGWLPLSKLPDDDGVLKGLWFYADSAYNEGELLPADEDGIYWVDRIGYRPADEGRENPFHQKKPRMHPKIKDADGTEHGLLIGDCKLELTGVSDLKPLDLAKGLPPAIETKALPDQELFTRFYREACLKMWMGMGKEGALMVVGSFLSYAAAPELFGKYGYFPGLWVHGQQGSGKSTVVGFGMEFYGIHDMYQGLILRSNSTTATGLLQMLDQISNLPAWVDEFRSGEVAEDKVAVLHNAFNRGGQAKYNPSRIQRAVRTAFVISGESTMQDSALRGRYPHIQISKSERWGTADEQKQVIDWIEKHRKYFFLFGRFLMENRREFVKRTLEVLKLWEKEEIDPRLKIVHGVAYASFMAMAQMTNAFSVDELNALRAFVLSHSRLAESDVKSETNINVFWDELLNAWKAGEVSADSFKVVYNRLPCPPNWPNQNGGWKEAILYFDPDAVIDQLMIYLTRKRAILPLKRKDLRDQLSKNEYWIDGKITMRLGPPGKMAQMKVWGISLDRHPLGRQDITDDQYHEWLMRRAQDDDESGEDDDPRHGPLYSIVSGVEKLRRERGREVA